MLPIEIIALIFEYIKINESLNLKLTCKTFKLISYKVHYFNGVMDEEQIKHLFINGNEERSFLLNNKIVIMSKYDFAQMELLRMYRNNIKLRELSINLNNCIESIKQIRIPS